MSNQQPVPVVPEEPDETTEPDDTVPVRFESDTDDAADPPHSTVVVVDATPEHLGVPPADEAPA